jgi:2-phosphosulfolactate phosphatase
VLAGAGPDARRVSRARVHVALVPPAPGRLPAPACAVAIDVLRASTTLAVAHANGAARIVPFAATAGAIAFRDRTPGALACGERDGRIVPGFDLGNSPGEFTAGRVRGRTLAFASTNGSRAMLAAAECRRRLLAGFVNLDATVQALAGEDEAWLVCAGKLGRFALEDAACAGTLAARLAARGATLAGDGARLAVALACGDPAQVRAAVEGCDHGRWLATLGEAYAEDVRFCAALDTVGSIAEW